MKLIETSRTIEVVDLKKVLYIEGYENYSKLHLADGEVLLTKVTLLSFEAEECTTFFRIHISYLINIIKVVCFHREGSVELTDGTRLPIARRRKKNFLASLKSAVDNDRFQP